MILPWGEGNRCQQAAEPCGEKFYGQTLKFWGD